MEIKWQASAVVNDIPTQRGTAQPELFREVVGTQGTRFKERELIQALASELTYDNTVPWIDDVTEETSEIKAAYRKMLGDSTVYGVIANQIFGVAARQYQVLPGGETDQDKLIAKFAWDNLECVGGMTHVAWAFGHGLWDCHAVIEPKYELRTDTVYGQRYWLTALKPKKIGEAVELEMDEFYELTGVKALNDQDQTVYDPSDFVIWSRLPFYANPRGSSALRAAYRPWFIIQAAWRWRARNLEKFLQPYILGKYPAGQAELKNELISALQKTKGGTFSAVPMEAQIEILNLAGKSEGDFKSSIDDCKRDIVFALTGATLQALEGEHMARAAADVHRETANLPAWFMSQEIPRILNSQLFPVLIGKNFVLPKGSALPRLTCSTEDEDDRIEAAEVLEKLLPHLAVSKEALYERFRLTPPKDDMDSVGGDGVFSFKSKISRTAPPPPAAGFGEGQGLSINGHPVTERQALLYLRAMSGV